MYVKVKVVSGALNVICGDRAVSCHSGTRCGHGTNSSSELKGFLFPKVAVFIREWSTGSFSGGNGIARW